MHQQWQAAYEEDADLPLAAYSTQHSPLLLLSVCYYFQNPNTILQRHSCYILSLAPPNTTQM